MNDLQIFSNPEFGRVRNVELNGQPWLVGADVATALGYKNPRKALADHIDPEDKGVTKRDTPGGEQDILIINESGLYSLILSSKMPKEQLAEVTDLRNDFIKHRDDYKARFIQAKANYGKICDSLRQAEGLVAKAQAELDSRIDQLQIIAFGLPGFDQIMADIFTTEKKE